MGMAFLLLFKVTLIFPRLLLFLLFNSASLA